MMGPMRGEVIRADTAKGHSNIESEFVPIAVLVGACVFISVRAEPVMRYAAETAEALYSPAGYIDAVLSARPRPTPTNAERLGMQRPESAQ